MKLRISIALLSLFLLSGPADATSEGSARISASLEGCRLAKGPTHGVVQVLDGETLRLDDGTELRLIGAMTPRTPLAGAAVDGSRWLTTRIEEAETAFTAPWPPAGVARRALEKLVLGRTVTLWHAVRDNGNRGVTLRDLPRDRYNRVLAQVTMDRGNTPRPGRLWLQAALLRSGLARVYSTSDTRGCVRQLLNHEAQAREANRGIWGHASYTVRSARAPDTLLDYAHTFQVVEGRVLTIGRTRNRVFLNFGNRWKTDFTLIVEGRAHRAFRQAGVDLSAMKGHRIRVRGWIEAKDGPMIRLTHPEQIEDLGLGDADTWNSEPDQAPAPSDHLAAFDQWRQREQSSVSRGSPSSDLSDPGSTWPSLVSPWHASGDDFAAGAAHQPEDSGKHAKGVSSPQAAQRSAIDRKNPAPTPVQTGQTPDSELLSM